MKAYQSFEDWMSDQTPAQQKQIRALCRLVRQCAAHYRQSVKWGQGCWLEEDKPRIYIHAEPDHLQFGFYAGSSLEDPDGLLVGKGKYVRHVKILPDERIPRQALTAFIEQLL